MEPALLAAARQASAREHERTREWLETRGLPKAARVAQRETYNLLRHFGLAEKSGKARVGLEVGRQVAPSETRAAGPLPPEELRELAEACAAMLEVHGRSVGETLAGLCDGVGGALSAEDAVRVRELAEALAGGAGGGRA